MARYAAAVLAGLLLLAGSARAQQEGQYKFKNRHSAKLLAVDESGARIIQDIAKKGDTREWKLVKAGDYFKIVDPKSGKVVTAHMPPKGSDAAGCTLEKDSGGMNQQWKFEKMEITNMTYFVIKCRDGERVLDVEGAEKAAGAPVITWPFNNKGDRGNQLWILESMK